MSKEFDLQAWRKSAAKLYANQFVAHPNKELNTWQIEKSDDFLAGMAAEAPLVELRGYARAMREIQCREMQISGDMPKEPEAQYHSVEGYCSMAAQNAEAQLARLLEKGEENGKV